MDKNKEPKQFLLFIFGEFKNNQTLVELISTQVSIFTDKETFLKYNYGDYGIVMNFQSHYDFYVLRDHIHIILEKIVPQYFLMERPNNLYAFMPPEMKLNLFDLNEENHNMEQKDESFKNMLNMVDNFLINITSSFNEDIFSEETMDKMFQKIMYKVDEVDNEPKPTMDQLLEKIKEKGLNSLTKKEIKILDEYSKS